MASKRKPTPPATKPKSRFLPPTVRSGSKVKASIIIVTGTKQDIKSAEIIKIILETLRFLFEKLEFPTVVDFLHLTFLSRFTTRIVVHKVMTTNATTGMAKLLIANEIFWTWVLSRQGIRVRRVLFLVGKNLKPNLLTTYTGDSQAAVIMKTQTITAAIRREVTMLLTWEKEIRFCH